MELTAATKNNSYQLNKEQNKEYFEKAITKGLYGEQLVADYLNKHVGDAFTQPTKNKAIKFDGFLLSGTSYNNQIPVLYDVKTKASFNKYTATGLDADNFNQYINFANKWQIPVLIYFVDEKLGWVYYGTIIDLNTSYVDEKDNIRYPNYQIGPPNTVMVSLRKMKRLFKLNTQQINKLKSLTNQNPKYRYE